MDSLPGWTRARRLVRAYKAQLRFCLRMTFAGVSAFALAQVLGAPLHGLWMVLTAVVVTQMSVGGSLRATVEYIVGTLGGAIYAGLVGVLVPQPPTAIAQGTALALCIAPLALAAALNPNFRVAPFSAVLVLLISGQLGGGPIESAVMRATEVALGGALAVIVSLLVFSQRAHGLALGEAARVLEQLAGVLPQLLAGFTHKIDLLEVRRQQDEIGRAVSAFQQIAGEVRRERVINLVAEPDPAPLSRTLLRLRHDLVIIARAGSAPLPDVLATRLGPLLERIGASAADHLRVCASALRSRGLPPPLGPVEAALAAYAAEVAVLRAEGTTRPLSTSAVEQMFALGFAFEHLGQNFSDLDRCIREWTRSPARDENDERDAAARDGVSG
jgi:uncharacterized membrane protein YccC